MTPGKSVGAGNDSARVTGSASCSAAVYWEPLVTDCVMNTATANSTGYNVPRIIQGRLGSKVSATCLGACLELQVALESY